MKQFFIFLLWLFASLGLAWFYSNGVGTLPPPGNFFSPLWGFWKNAEPQNRFVFFSEEEHPIGLIDEVKVVMDERMVAHVFANNEQDLFFMQGYITAKHRLWQMDIQIRSAEGRISEVVGERALKLDKQTRRLGLRNAAFSSEAYWNKDPKNKLMLDAYTAGVNAWIEQLKPQDYPVEFKLLNYAPELWSPFKTALLLKYMANMLSGYDRDIELSNTVKMYGEALSLLLFPDMPDTLLDPVIPKGTLFNPIENPIEKPIDKELSYLDKLPVSNFLPMPDPHYGSNNWAVAGSRTESGKPILCNDPHLGLNLPSIWYEIQLHAPEINVYGASLPGAPCVISGFNDSIAWGITNAAMDVKDWYTITFRDETRSHYLFEGEWLPVDKKIEVFFVKGQTPVYDTILYTQHGPISFDKTFHSSPDEVNLALRWTAHDLGNEARTFYLLNKAQNHADYQEALKHYACPGQNFVFASAHGDIAIQQQGKFVHRWETQGRTILDGSRSDHLWQGFIPTEHNPHSLNPERGFVSSANQHPVDESWPYYYTGHYEYYRNRRINERLGAMDKVRMADMQKLQNDNFNILSAEAIPLLLKTINKDNLTDEQRQYVNALREWDNSNDAEQSGPVYFEIFWKAFENLLWDEFIDSGRKMMLPEPFYTVRYLQKEIYTEFIDHQATDKTETLHDLVLQTLDTAIVKLEEWKSETGRELTWANYKFTRVTHIARLDAFSEIGVMNGGNFSVVNATSSTKGPSWRMIVSPGNDVEAFGIYPGGQSGNPGSKFYSNFIDDWAKGKYYSLKLYKENESGLHILSSRNFHPAKR